MIMKYLCLHTHKPCTPMQTYVCKYICMFTYECVCAISKLLQQLVHLDSVAADTASCCMLHSVCMSLCVCVCVCFSSKIYWYSLFVCCRSLAVIVVVVAANWNHNCCFVLGNNKKEKKIADAAGAFFCCPSRTQTFPADTYKHTQTHTHTCMHTCMFVCTCST